MSFRPKVKPNEKGRKMTSSLFLELGNFIFKLSRFRQRYFFNLSKANMMISNLVVHRRVTGSLIALRSLKIVKVGNARMLLRKIIFWELELSLTSVNSKRLWEPDGVMFDILYVQSCIGNRCAAQNLFWQKTKLGVIHKPRGQFFGYFWPPPPSWSSLM